MNSSQTRYTTCVIAGGFVAFGLCLARVLTDAVAWPAGLSRIPYCLVMGFLMIVCRLLPISLAQDRTLELTFVPVLACVMTSSMELAVVLFGLAALVYFSVDPSTHEVTYLLLRQPRKELFNIGNILLSIALGGLPLALLPRPTALASLQALGLALLFSLLNIFANLCLFVGYYQLGGAGTFRQLVLQNVGGILPNIFSTVPLGLLLAIALLQPNGYFYIIVFLAPLALARYSFKLYLESKSMYMRTISALSMAIEAKDTYTQGHSRRVAYYSAELARALHKPAAYVDEIRIAALLHDIGKIGINDAVLNKPGRLTDAEFDMIRSHPALGHKIIQSIHLSPTINDAVLYHHRRYDGGGYPGEPDGGGQPFSAAILAVADTYDAMTSDRPYRKGMPQAEAVAELKRVAGTQLNPEVVDAFLSILPRLDGQRALEEDAFH